MAPYVRVFNLTTHRYVKPGQARGWVNDGVCVWVEAGATIRSLTFAEMVQQRSVLSREYEPFPLAELPGLLVAGLLDIRQERSVARDGTRFAVCRMAEVCR